MTEIEEFLKDYVATIIWVLALTFDYIILYPNIGSYVSLLRVCKIRLYILCDNVLKIRLYI